MKSFRLFFTIFFLLTSLIIILLIALFDKMIFFSAADLIKNYIWPAAIALLLFLILLSIGVVSNHADIKPSLINNGYFQLAILELFLLSAGLAYFRHYIQQPGQIILRLDPESTGDFINLGVTYQISGSTTIDTVTAPGTLDNRPAGNYSIETLDQDIVYFRADVVLEPKEIETLVIPVTPNIRTLAVQTEPTGAEIWINGVQTTQTPDTFKILTGDSVILELKLPGYQGYTDTLRLNENVDLGVISLRKLYTLWISSRYADIVYRIYDWDDKVVFSSYGSRKLQLAQGKYRISFEIGEGQYETKTLLLNYNASVVIP
jgi:hypothetical protein